LLKKTLSQIVEGNNDYIVQLKANAKSLYVQAIQGAMDEESLSEASSRECNKGRLEYRHVYVFDAQSAIANKSIGANKILVVYRSTKRNGDFMRSVKVYLTSLDSNDAKLYLDLIRKHWWIENKLHYVKDVVLLEDYTKFNHNKRSKFNAIYRNIAVHCIKCKGLKSVKYALEKCANHVKRCLRFLRI